MKYNNEILEKTKKELFRANLVGIYVEEMVKDIFVQLHINDTVMEDIKNKANEMAEKMISENDNNIWFKIK